MSDHGNEFKLLGMMAIQDVAFVKEDLTVRLEDPELIINLESVDHIDTTVIQCLYAAIKHREDIGLDTNVVGVNDIVKEAIEGLGLLAEFGIS